MTLPERVREVTASEGVLIRTGWACWFITGLLILATAFDPREILGIDPWVKPAKFAASFAIFSWTVAVFLVDLKVPAWVRHFARWGIVAFIVLEQFVISFQSARGVTSHFNDATALDRGIYESMRCGVILNTVVVLVILVCAFRTKPRGDAAWLWGVRYGLIVFVLGGFEGIVMSVRHAHSVGVPDGGPGLAIVHWSTTGGDLRIAHFLGLHALQLLPLAGWIIDRLSRRRPALGRHRIIAVSAFSTGYLMLVAYLVWRALRGIPLVSFTL